MEKSEIIGPFRGNLSLNLRRMERSEIIGTFRGNWKPNKIYNLNALAVELQPKPKPNANTKPNPNYRPNTKLSLTLTLIPMGQLLNARREPKNKIWTNHMKIWQYKK